MTRIALINGHPDPAGTSYCHALADAYAAGAAAAGHSLDRIDVAQLDFPLLRNMAEFEKGAPPPDIVRAQEALQAADLWVIVYPLWLGDVPAVLKGFFEQTMRPGFAFKGAAMGPGFARALAGKSARIVITMGMPALAYRFFFGAHSLKSLERNILRFAGIRPIRRTLIGMMGKKSAAQRQKILDKMERLGRKAA